MSPDIHFHNSLRSSIAIAVWSLLTVLLSLVGPDGSAVAAICVVLLVSTLNAFALSIVDRNSSNRRRRLQAVISFGIALSWALRLGTGKEPSLSVILIAVAFVPVALVYFGVKYRSQINRLEFRHLASRNEPELVESVVVNSTDHIKPKLAIGLYETDARQSDEPTVVWKSPDSPDVTQWLTRSLTAGGDVIEGGVRVEFLEWQRDATVHVSFCPPFRSTPDITTEDLDDAGVEIRIAAVFPFGARLTVRRVADPALNGTRLTAETCRIGFVALAMPAKRAA